MPGDLAPADDQPGDAADMRGCSWHGGGRCCQGERRHWLAGGIY
jgi:hypothetical protein